MIKVLLTGSTGFLGNYIYKVLSQSTDLITISRADANIKADLSIEIPKLSAVALVIHCAGKVHSVPKTEIEKQQFFQVNVKGTENLLKGLEQSPSLPKSFVFISSVSVYGQEIGTGIDEEHPLLAKDAYGESKIEAEQIAKKWCDDNQVVCTILRLPLLVGENPPGNLGAMIKAIERGYYFNIGGGIAKKSMVLASDVAQFIPIVAPVGGIFNLTDGVHPDFASLSAAVANSKKKKKPLNMPLFLAKFLGLIGDFSGNKAPINSLKIKKITSDLTFDDSKARNLMKWNPQEVLEYLKKNAI